MAETTRLWRLSSPARTSNCLTVRIKSILYGTNRFLCWRKQGLYRRLRVNGSGSAVNAFGRSSRIRARKRGTGRSDFFGRPMYITRSSRAHSNLRKDELLFWARRKNVISLLPTLRNCGLSTEPSATGRTNASATVGLLQQIGRSAEYSATRPAATAASLTKASPWAKPVSARTVRR